MGLTRIRAEQISDIDYKQAVRVITLTNIDLSGGAPSQVDSVNLQVGNRVLVNGQDNAAQNGLYVVQTLGTGGNGTWVRTSDANQDGEIQSGMVVMVTEGVTYADTPWKLVTNGEIVLGVTELIFQENYSLAFGNIFANGTAIIANTVSAPITFVAGANVSIIGNNTTKTVTISAAGGGGGGGSGTAIVNGTSNVDIATADANITMSVDGVSNVVVVSTEGITVAGNVIGNGISVTTVSGSPPANAEQGDIWIDSDTGVQLIYFNDGNSSQWAEMEAATNISIGSDVDFGNIASNVLPSANITYNLGSADRRWNDIWLANSTIHLGEVSISSAGGNLELPAMVQIGTVMLESHGGNLILPSTIQIGNATLSDSDGNLMLPENIMATTVDATANISGGNIISNGMIEASGNITGNYILGNGSQLTGLPEGFGNANVATFMADFGSNVIDSTGNITTTANISGNYILGNGSQLTGVSAGLTKGQVMGLMIVFGR